MIVVVVVVVAVVVVVVVVIELFSWLFRIRSRWNRGTRIRTRSSGQTSWSESTAAMQMDLCERALLPVRQPLILKQLVETSDRCKHCHCE